MPAWIRLKSRPAWSMKVYMWTCKFRLTWYWCSFSKNRKIRLKVSISLYVSWPFSVSMISLHSIHLHKWLFFRVGLAKKVWGYRYKSCFFIYFLKKVLILQWVLAVACIHINHINIFAYTSKHLTWLGVKNQKFKMFWWVSALKFHKPKNFILQVADLRMFNSGHYQNW